MRVRVWFEIGCVTLASVGFAGCGTEFKSCEDNGSCGSGEGGAAGAGLETASSTGGTTSTGGGEGAGGGSAVGGSGGSGGGEPSCEAGSREVECLAAEAVFVDGQAEADGTGSLESPARSINRGIELAEAQGKSLLLVCEGEYHERLLIDDGPSLVILGGYACDDWSYDEGIRAKLMPSAPGVVVDVVGQRAALSMAQIDIEALAGETHGASSVAVRLVGSSNVSFSDLAIIAGDGHAGSDGVTTPVEFPDRDLLRGLDASSSAGGEQVAVECPADGTTVGAAGGGAGDARTVGETGQPDHGGGDGGAMALCDQGGTGGTGQNAPPASAGTGATSLGTLIDNRWVPGAGEDGQPGQPGQGGGGGGGAESGGGGGGGAGSCGGAAGKGGGGGGASIALLAIQTDFELTNVELVAGRGGDGGSGSIGQDAQQEWGTPGQGAEDGCAGGRGGLGAKGGDGGGGPGGFVAGLFLVDSSIDDHNVDITVGEPGTGGDGASDNSGINGVSEPVHLVGE